MAHRQEVLNVHLAQLLQERGLVSTPENIQMRDGKRHMPDVLVLFQGLRTAIEGEYEAADAKKKAVESAQERVELGIAHIGIGVVYPLHLKDVAYADLPAALATAHLQIAVVTENGASGFVSGDVQHLERTLRSTFDQLIKEDVVADSVALLDSVVDQFAAALTGYRGAWGKITQALSGSITDKQLDALSEKERAANCRIGGLVLVNAMIFHDILAGAYPNITALKALDDYNQFPKQWQYILDEINFYSIFHLAKEIFLAVPDSIPDAPRALRFMVDAAQKISNRRAALRHDLMGRVYHRLLADAKYLGTYYTSIPAARLLLALALRPQGWDIAWEDVNALAKLKVADLACGTGTLLMASAESILDNHVSSAVQHDRQLDLPHVHQYMAENILHGYDVLPSAIHLTASTLAVRSPDVPFKKMNLFAMPYGGADNRLGSLEFLTGNMLQLSLGDMFTPLEGAQQMTGHAMNRVRHISVPELDLCVMNPPFVRSVGGNLLFGSMPTDERAEMQTKLKKVVKKSGIQASITSGLGSVFVGLANKHIRKGGRLALVLPKALFSGVSWDETRQLVNRDYRLDYLIVSHDAEHWNFSESTDLSEAMLVATKNPGTKSPEGHKTIVVNLWRNPRTAVEALTIARDALQNGAPDLLTGKGAKRIVVDGQMWGEILSVDDTTIKQDWFLPCAFAQSDLIRTAYHLIRGRLWLPTTTTEACITVTPLNTLGKLGPDRRDLKDAFDDVSSPTPYEAFWGHDAKAMNTIQQKSNRYLLALSEARKGRNLRKAEDMWQLAGNMLISGRMRLNTQSLMAVYLPQPVLSNVWWSFALKSEIPNQNQYKALVLWFNSTLNFLIQLSARNETEGAFVDFRKAVLQTMPVLDIRALSETQLAALADAYDKLCDEPLKPLPQMASDETRQAIDKAIAQALQLPDFSILRTMLGREPVVTMKRL